MRGTAVTLALLLVGLGATPAADAAITGTSGDQIRQIVGDEIDLTMNEQSDILALNEKQDVTLGSTVRAEIARCPGAYPCTYDAPEKLTTGVRADLPPGVVVDSHILHLNTSRTNQTRTGCVSFDSDVIGVIAYSGSLTSSESPNDDSDPNGDRVTTDLGKPGVKYATSSSAPSAYTHRGVEFSTNDWVRLAADRRTVCVGFYLTSNIDEIRVLTAGVNTLELVASDPRDGNSRCATATVRTQAVPDASGAGADPAPGIPVRFNVSGVNSASGSVVSDGDGTASYCYTGETPMQDRIEAFADIDGDGVRDAGEQGAVAAGDGGGGDDQLPPGPPVGLEPELPSGKPPSARAEEPPPEAKATWRAFGQKPPPGSVCTRSGTSKKDRIVGTRGDDVLCGRGGNDVIDGRGGNDHIYGGKGKDRLDGGKGKDRLYGGSSADTLNGGPGDDQLYGAGGRDRLLGGSGRDGAYLVTSGDRYSSVERRSPLAAAQVLAFIARCTQYDGYFGLGQIEAGGPEVRVDNPFGEHVQVYGSVAAYYGGGVWRQVHSRFWAPNGQWLYLPPGTHDLNYYLGFGLDGRTPHTISYFSYHYETKRLTSNTASVRGPLQPSDRAGEYWCR